MFIMHISAIFALSVLLGSTALIIWSLRNPGAGSAFGKTIGTLVFIGAVLSLSCIAYYGVKYWYQGSFETPTGISMQMGNDMSQKMMPMMMEQMMPMMMEHMKEHMGQMGNMGDMQQKGNMENMGMQKGESHHPAAQ